MDKDELVRLAERVWERCATSGDCLEWSGARNDRGYGQIWDGEKVRYTHRVVYEATNGVIHPGLQIDHLCRNRGCCNPKHLFWGSHQANMDDCAAKGRRRGAPPKIDLAELVRRRAEGASYSTLAAEFGVNQASIGKALQRIALRARSPEGTK